MSTIKIATINQWFGLLVLSGLLVGCGGGSSTPDDIAPPVDPPMNTSVDTATTDCGAYQGLILTDDVAPVISFKGVPYAAPPVGDLRWQAPQALDCSADVQTTFDFAEPCAQLEGDGSVTSLAEDCLYLNVWTPADEFPSDDVKPVLFFIHGGGNTRGSPSEFKLGTRFYDGQRLAARADAVVVTVSYRLNAFGFLAHPALSAENFETRSGNYGILDQIAALEWVQRNIGVFGGDPQQVAIFGESGGARDVCTLVASPLASGLFSGAIMQSGSCRQPTLSEREIEGVEIAEFAGCTSTTDSSCLRDADVLTLLEAVGAELNDGALVAENVGPAVDGYLLNDSPHVAIANGSHNLVPMIIGANTEETGNFGVTNLNVAGYENLVLLSYGAFFGNQILDAYPADNYPTPRDAWIALTGDAQFVCPSKRIAKSATQHAPPVYVYRFAQAFDNVLYGSAGAFHGIELFHIFQQTDNIDFYTQTTGDAAVEQAMAGYWSAFAANQNPNSGTLGFWETYSPTEDRVLLIGNDLGMVAEPLTAQCEFWDQFSNFMQ
ncbi:MAG: carboxylesterase family protein [Gammaproteobacteria bacterium]|nr:carboxylesterase family protein [Gammaproteobacteria bacterium]